MIQQLRKREYIKRLQELRTPLKQSLGLNPKQKDSLHVVYIMNQVGVWGGVKIVLEHANRLTSSGFKVTILSHFPRPDWYSFEGNYIKVPFSMDVAEAIPNCDVIVATYWDQIDMCIKTGIAPVIYFEQGDNHLFDYENLNEETREIVKQQYQLPKFIFTVSNQTAILIKKYYNRDSKVIHNAIDEKVFHSQVDSFKWKNDYILMMGSDKAEFKGIRDILDAYKLVKKKKEHLDLIWISPNEPEFKNMDKSLISKYMVNPPQELIASLYKGALMFVSGSHYESFSLPVLEAMSCGCPVISTSNPGVLEYALDEKNVLLTEIKNSEAMSSAMLRILDNTSLQEALITNGLKTASQFSWDIITKKLASYYTEVSRYYPVQSSTEDDWNITISKEDFNTSDDYEKFMKTLLTCKENFVQIPFSYELIDDHPMAIWTTVATRKTQNVDSQENKKVYCKTKISKDIEHLPEAYKIFHDGKYDACLHMLNNNLLLETDSQKKAVYIKWIALCLIELQRDKEAFSLLKKSIQVYNNNSDLYYLLLLVSFFLKNANNAAAENEAVIKQVINIMGDCTDYMEFFINVEQLISKHLPQDH
ncbi:glycosyltransferase family 4 protein [Radiobacillus deserti]|uniref:Glycosyltransferase family 4 protein n=1 Tax=Radiobacillus deserti TaxID=2594883 RepID=A0A516KIQ3_9BACI|nr:glycosyltransferase family 4 protein [Radiobacillus deserti]QDP41273.1 glycosyltransferase family 4 protein [Radiobacillus deserti]